jgi:hypothetical protein
MADFTVVPTSGLTVADWLDPPSSSGQPSRLNASANHPNKRYVAAVGTPVVLKAVVGGVVGPADAALGGRLFVGYVIEAPGMPTPGLASPAGFSSVLTIIPAQAGHYTVRVRRPNGGNEHIHFDAA